MALPSEKKCNHIATYCLILLIRAVESSILFDYHHKPVGILSKYSLFHFHMLSPPFFRFPFPILIKYACSTKSYIYLTHC